MCFDVCTHLAQSSFNFDHTLLITLLFWLLPPAAQLTVIAADQLYVKMFCGAFLCALTVSFSAKLKINASLPLYAYSQFVLSEHPDTLFDADDEVTREDGQKKLLSIF